MTESALFRCLHFVSAKRHHILRALLLFFFAFNKIIKYASCAQCDNKRLNMNLVQTYILFLSFIFIARTSFLRVLNRCRMHIERDTHISHMNIVCCTILIDYQLLYYIGHLCMSQNRLAQNSLIVSSTYRSTLCFVRQGSAAPILPAQQRQIGFERLGQYHY